MKKKGKLRKYRKQMMYKDNGIVIAIDKMNETLIVNDITYSFNIFKAWGKGGIALNEPFVITKRQDGVLTFSKDYIIIGMN